MIAALTWAAAQDRIPVHELIRGLTPTDELRIEAAYAEWRRRAAAGEKRPKVDWHSYPVPDAEKDISKRDCTGEEFRFVSAYLQEVEYDDYDRLMILCDALGEAAGFCILEKRFVDVTRRYGVFPFTVDRWNKTFEYKEYFDGIAKRSVYELLPGIERCIYN